MSCSTGDKTRSASEWPEDRSAPIRIAVLDYFVVPSNPIGGCHRRMLEGLADEHEFTVFAVRFDNPRPDRIRHVRVPAPSRPLALLFVVFHVTAPLVLLAHRLRTGSRYDLVQKVESNLVLGDVTYSQFSHRSYLRRHWKASRPPGIRRPLRWLDHRLHALAEPVAYRRALQVVNPSRGLAEELAGEFPEVAARIRVVPNPVDLAACRPPASFDRERRRKELGFGPEHLVVAFVALGHFERKGLPLLLHAVRALDDPRLRLLVVGGERDLVASYQTRAASMGIDGSTAFVGAQPDVKPFLWAADAFGFPSHYETFGLAVVESAAAALPVLATPLHGVADWLRDGENGVLVEPTSEGVTSGLRRLLDLPPGRVAEMGAAAQRSVASYGVDRFVEGWRRVYDELETERRAR